MLVAGAPLGGSTGVTPSTGGATLTAVGDATRLLVQIDATLHEAKRAGRNLVRI